MELFPQLVHEGKVVSDKNMTDKAFDTLTERKYESVIGSLLKSNIQISYPLLVSKKLDGISITIKFNSDGEPLYARTKNNKEIKLDRLNIPFIPDGECELRFELVAKQKSNTINSVSIANRITQKIDYTQEDKDSVELILTEQISPEIRQIDLFKKYPCVTYDIVNNEEELNVKLNEYVSGCQPCDGLVYSKQDWIYNQDYGVNHGKYAKKSSNEIRVKIVNSDDWVEYTMKEGGSLGAKIFYEEVKIQTKTYKTITMTPHNLFINKISKGSSIYITTPSSDFPQFCSICEDTIETNYEIPKECPFCSVPTKYDKDILRCTNSTCWKRHNNLILNIIDKCIGKCGLGEATLRNKTCIAGDERFNVKKLLDYKTKKGIVRDLILSNPNNISKIQDLVLKAKCDIDIVEQLTA